LPCCSSDTIDLTALTPVPVTATGVVVEPYAVVGPYSKE